MSFAHFYSDLKQTDMIQAAGSYYRLAGAEKACYWKDIPKLVAAEPNIMAWWIQRIAEIFPLPEDRWYNPETRWIERVEGKELTETDGEGEKADAEEHVAPKKKTKKKKK